MIDDPDTDLTTVRETARKWMQVAVEMQDLLELADAVVEAARTGGGPKRYHDSAGARAVQIGMRALTGWSYLARAQAAIAAVAVCRGMRRLCAGGE